MSYIKIVLCHLHTGRHTTQYVSPQNLDKYIGNVFINGEWYRGWTNEVSTDERGVYAIAEDYYTILLSNSEKESLDRAYRGTPPLNAMAYKLRAKNLLKSSGELTKLGERILLAILIFDKTTKNN